MLTNTRLTGYCNGIEPAASNGRTSNLNELARAKEPIPDFGKLLG